MDLELVEDARGERESRDAGAVDEHVLVARARWLRTSRSRRLPT
jgi:hypothetical protein